MATCSVRGFVPSRRVVLRRRTPRLLYPLRFTLAPHTRSARSVDVTLAAYPSVLPGLVVDRPAGTRPDPVTTESVLRAVPGGSSVLDPYRGLSWRVRNRSATQRRYLAYAGATVYSGSWSARVCGGRRNDGRSVTTLRGTFTLVGRIRAGLVGCGDRARPGATALRRVAAQVSCRPSPRSYRQFHDPSG